MAEQPKAKYAEVGRKMISLAKTTDELAAVLGVSEGRTKMKLSGRADVTLNDLGKLALHYGVPRCWFLMGESATSVQAACVEMFCGEDPTLLRRIVEVCTELSESGLVSALESVAWIGGLERLRREGLLRAEAPKESNGGTTEPKPGGKADAR